ncbi:MAG: tryptophan synthase subunit alpha [Verrucomicrobiota bacterium]
MKRIDSTFAKLKAANQSAFVAYIAAGDPNLEVTKALALEFDRIGVDVLELGVPFSDPMADGSVNQAAAERALEAGTSVPGVFKVIREIRKESEIPIVLFAYLNPVYTYGFERFFRDAEDSGADGILLLDLPPEEQAANQELANVKGLQCIRLIAPTTPSDRIQAIANQAEGFIYYVSREGVTGVQSSLAEGLEEQVGQVCSASSVPVVVGFGISQPEQAATVARCADGVVVGSGIVKTIAENLGSGDLVAKVSDFVEPLVNSTKSARA